MISYLQKPRSILTLTLSMIYTMMIGQSYEIQLQYSGPFYILNSIEDSTDFFNLNTIQISNEPFDISRNKELSKTKNNNSNYPNKIKFDVINEIDSTYLVSYNLKSEQVSIKDISGRDSTIVQAIVGQQFKGIYNVSNDMLYLYFNKTKHKYKLEKVGNYIYLRRQLD